MKTTILVFAVTMIFTSFVSYGVSPTVTTTAASSIDSFSATLNGTVNPNGSNVVAYFSWGTTPSYSGNDVPSPPWTKSGNTTINLSYTMTNLSANTKYYYQTVSYVFGNSGNISYGGSSNFTTLYPPILNVSPSSGLTSTGYFGGPFIQPNEPYSVANINVGSGTLKWTAGADQNWVTVSPTNGQTTVGNPTTVTVSFNGNANSLAIGSHSSTVTFGGNGGSTTRQVQLTVSSPPPALSVSPLTGLTSSGPQGGSFSPASKPYTISNTGGGTLNWSASANSNWVTVLPGSGQNSGTVTVSINNNANSLSAQGYSWTYQSLVTFSANVGYYVTNIILPVNLTVNTSPQLSVSPSGYLTASGDHGGPFTPSQQYSLSNVGTGTLNWTAGADANWVTVSSSSGQNSGNVTVSINSNANSLQTGTHSSTVTFGGNGGNITRQVQLTVTNAPVSSTLSFLTATPSSAPADGSSQIAATVTLRDIYSNSVAGRTVQFYAIGSVSINQPVNPTDANGQATATITANTPGTVTITAKDTTDNVAVQQPATVTFTQQTLVVPNSNLGNAITTLYQSSASALNGGVLSISATATNAGALGNAFRNGMTADKASIILDAAFGVLRAVLRILKLDTTQANTQDLHGQIQYNLI